MQLEVAITTATGPDPRDLERHRTRIEHLWTERFDKEREGFVASNGLSPTRPLASEPIAWRYLSFEEALVLGAQMERPLFVDVMAFWCVWCYRMDYYTYVDAEVAQLLNESFVPVKIIQEQAVEGDYERVREKLDARGIPAMGVFDGEGNALHKISGWKKPEDFLTDLNAGLAAFKGDGN
jgi:thiol-disulfide isomerase/thioredoxin